MRTAIEIRRIEPGEETLISGLVTATFQHDVAPLYSREGIREFLTYANPDALRDRQARNHTVLVAFHNQTIVGVLELREACHVSLLFVAVEYQRQGVGRRLVMEALQLIRSGFPEIQEVTVNSSPNAVGAYLRFGFQATGELQVKHGIGFVPMRLPLASMHGA